MYFSIRRRKIKNFIAKTKDKLKQVKGESKREREAALPCSQFFYW